MTQETTTEIKVFCPACGHRLQVSNNSIGVVLVQVVRCLNKSCDEVFQEGMAGINATDAIKQMLDRLKI